MAADARAEADDDAPSIWVASDVGVDNGTPTYVLAIHYSDDLVHTLDDDSAWAYALTVCTASAVADYEAAQFAQLTKRLRLSPPQAVTFLDGMRKRRGRTTWTAGPLTLTPGVSLFTGEPFLQCHAGGPRWQWSPADANQHAHHVIELVPVVELDAAYHDYLTEKLDIGSDRAHNVVQDILTFRFPASPSAAPR